MFVCVLFELIYLNAQKERSEYLSKGFEISHKQEITNINFAKQVSNKEALS